MRKLLLTYALIVGALVYGWQASAQLTSTGFGGGFGNGSSGCGYLTQSCAIFAAFTTPPTTPRKVIINTLVNALLNGSTDTWDKMDVLYVMSAADNQAALINWKTPGTTTLVGINSPNFVADTGYNSDGSSSYLTTNVAFNFGTNLTQNSVHLGGWLLGGDPSAVSSSIWGRQTSSGNYNLSLQATSGTQISSRNSTTAADAATSSVQSGYLSSSRTGASLNDIYYNGGLLVSPNSTSVGVGSGNAQILSSGGFFSPSTSIASIAHFGGQFNSTDTLNACQAFGAYLTSLGAIGSSPC